MFSTIILKRVPAVLTGMALIFSIALQPSLAANSQPEPPPGYYRLKPYKLPANPTTLDRKILAAMEEYNIVGLSAAVFRDNKIIWSGGYGWSNLNTERQMTPGSVFRVASLSKTVTATALMQLYDQGKFGLDDDISKYLGYQVRNPQYPAVKITFRQLLTHTSSIVDNGAYDQIAEETPELLREIRLKDLLTPTGKFYSSATFADYAPGTDFSYSNLGTGIVGSLVEAISGIPFEKYCTKYIFKPLNMDASFEPADIKNWTNFATLYRPDTTLTAFKPTKDDFNDAKPAPTVITAPLGNALGRSPMGGLRSSSTDFAKFMIAHMNGGSANSSRILKADTADLMHSLQWYGCGMDGFYKQKGLNFHVTDDLVPGQRLVGHSGEAYGLSSDAYFDPDSKFGMVFMMNGANYTAANPFYSVENSIAKTLFDSFAPKGPKKPRNIKGKPGATAITVNARKIMLPVPVAINKTAKSPILFLPAIATADALKTGISQTGDTLTFTYGQTTAILTANKIAMMVNGKTTMLSQAPYKQNGHLMVPIRELATALKINAKFSF